MHFTQSVKSEQKKLTRKIYAILLKAIIFLLILIDKHGLAQISFLK